MGSVLQHLLAAQSKVPNYLISLMFYTKLDTLSRIRYNPSMPRNRMRKIRLQMGYSIADFAELLGYKKPTYQCYENGTRPLPVDALKNAQDAQKRDVKFFRELPVRVDKYLKGKAVPNEARSGVWY